MSGSPNLVSIQGQWDNYLAVLERMRRWGDDTLLTQLEQIEKAVEGDYTPQGQASFTATTRSSFASHIARTRVAVTMGSLIYEYGKFIGSPYTELPLVFRDIFDYNHDNAVYVPSRNITHGAPAVVVAAGDGDIRRLVFDEYGRELEACRVETKRFICRSDQSSGAQKHAEVWEVHGDQPSIDALNLLNMGTGALGTLVSHHAGTGVGGSILGNSSFSSFNEVSKTFPSWEFSPAPTPDAEQDTVNFFRSYPGATVDASAKISGNCILRQYISTSARRLSVGSPYFLRLMYNPDVYSCTGADLTIKIGTTTHTIPVVIGSGWQEIVLPFSIAADGQKLWYRNFNEQDLAVEIQIANHAGGAILLDDLLCAPWDIVDGTYEFISGGATPWLLDDEYSQADTGGDPGTQGILNYWTYIGGYGYLPHDGVPSWADPVIP